MVRGEVCPRPRPYVFAPAAALLCPTGQRVQNPPPRAAGLSASRAPVLPLCNLGKSCTVSGLLFPHWSHRPQSTYLGAAKSLSETQKSMQAGGPPSPEATRGGPSPPLSVWLEFFALLDGKLLLCSAPQGRECCGVWGDKSMTSETSPKGKAPSPPLGVSVSNDQRSSSSSFWAFLRQWSRKRH